MKKTILGIIVLTLMFGTVEAITLGTFLGLDLDNLNRNINKVGIVKSEGFNGATEFNYLVEYDSIIEDNGTFPVVTKDCNYNINKENYKRCVVQTNKTFCLNNLKNDIRDYCKNKIESDLERIKALQEEAMSQITDEEIEADLNTLDIGII